MNKLMPCPFCGSCNLSIFSIDVRKLDAHVRCADCDASGPMSTRSDQDAVNLWNSRTFRNPYAEKASSEKSV